MAHNRPINSGSVKFMFAGLAIGPKATDSRSWNFPSQPKTSPNATSINDGERRAMLSCFSPVARGRPSAHDSEGLWHVAQERAREPDSKGSKKSILPRADFASEKGLSSRKGI